MRSLLLTVIATVLVFGGCSNVSSIGDGGTADVDTDGDADTDSDSDTGTDTDTGPIECNLGEYSGFLIIDAQSDIEAFAGYTSISGNLYIYSCTELSELICLTSVGGNLSIAYNAALTDLGGLSALTSVGGMLGIGGNATLTNLDGLSALTSVGGWLEISNNTALTNLDGLGSVASLGGSGTLYINDNTVLPDCEACDLLDQLISGPASIDVYDNLDDTCTPVPGSCP